MFHHAAKTLDHRLAFATWEEGCQLWEVVVRASPGLVSLCVMPDHIHVLTPEDVRVSLAAALSGFARWRNHRRGERGPMWCPLPEPSPVVGDLKIRRNIRYIHLNPCRAGLVSDPLAWPLSTHADAVGLSLRPVRRRMHHPVRFHAAVSGDPSVRPEGTDLPVGIIGVPELHSVEAAVSMAARLPATQLRTRCGDGRARVMGAARVLTAASSSAIGAHLGVSKTAAVRARRPDRAELTVIERWIDDPRCMLLEDAELRRLLSRSRYRSAR